MLSLRENRIRSLPTTVGNLLQLLTLDVAHNHLEHLPNEIGLPLSLWPSGRPALSFRQLRSIDNAGFNAQRTRRSARVDRQSEESQSTIDQIQSSFGHSIVSRQLLEARRVQHRRKQCLAITGELMTAEAGCQVPSLLFRSQEGLLSSLVHLNTISLARNNFNSFPLGGPTQFTSVHSINMECNTIDKIPFSIFSLAKYLSKLNMRENALTSLPLGRTCK